MAEQTWEQMMEQYGEENLHAGLRERGAEGWELVCVLLVEARYETLREVYYRRPARKVVTRG